MHWMVSPIDSLGGVLYCRSLGYLRVKDACGFVFFCLTTKAETPLSRYHLPSSQRRRPLLYYQSPTHRRSLLRSLRAFDKLTAGRYININLGHYPLYVNKLGPLLSTWQLPTFPYTILGP
jgi:hypothetical protein